MGVYVWGTGCGASELMERGFSRECITAFVETLIDYRASFDGRLHIDAQTVDGLGAD